jgi:hypothetical protein
MEHFSVLQNEFLVLIHSKTQYESHLIFENREIKYFATKRATIFAGTMLDYPTNDRF